MRKLDRRGNSNRGGGRGLAKAQLDRFLSLFTSALSFVDFFLYRLHLSKWRGPVWFCVCVLSLVPDDSLYFTSLHFSSLSLRVVSHQQRKPRPPYNTALPSSLLRQISIPSPPKTLGSPCFYFLLASSFSFFFFLGPFPFCCPRCREKRRKKCQALLVTVLPISVAKLADPRLILSDGLEN